MLSSIALKIIKKSPQTRIVVVSAQSGVTNLLVELVTTCATKACVNNVVQQISAIINPILDSICDLAISNKIKLILDDLIMLGNMAIRLKTPQLSDEVLSFGEHISAILVTSSLVNKGLSAIYLDAKTIIKTNSHFGHAKALIQDIKTNSDVFLLPLVKDHIVVMEGFVGSDIHGQTTTLGRGGSDYSASLIAESTKAEALYIWTDVPGIYQVDPRVIPTAQAIKKHDF